MRKEVIFSGKDDGLSSLLQRFRSDYGDVKRAMAEGLVSGDDINKLKEQIRLQEQAVRLSRQQQTGAATSQYAQAVKTTRLGSPERTQAIGDYKRQIQQVNEGLKKDEEQVRLLKELVQVTKETSRKETSTDKKLAHEEHAREERENLRRRTDDTSSRSVARGADYNRGSGISQGMTRFGQAFGLASQLAEGNGAGAVDTISNALMMSGNPYAMAAGGALKVGSAAYSMFAEFGQDESFQQLSGLTGVRATALQESKLGRGPIGGFEYGIDRDQYLADFLLPSIQAGGGFARGQRNVRGAMRLAKGAGMDTGTIMQAIETSRLTTDVDTGEGVAQNVFRNMVGSGQFGKGGKDLTRLPALMQTAMNIERAQFQRTGIAGDIQSTTGVMAAISKLGGTYGTEMGVQRSAAALDQGLASGGNPSFKYAMLAMSNPNLNPLEMGVEMKKGVGAKGMLENTLKMVEGVESKFARQMILTQAGVSDDLAIEMAKDPSGFLKNMTETPTGPGVDLDTRAKGTTNVLKNAGDEFMDKVSQAGDDFKGKMLSVFEDPSWDNFTKLGVSWVGLSTGVDLSNIPNTTK